MDDDQPATPDPAAERRRRSGSETRQRPYSVPSRYDATELTALKAAAALAGLTPAAFQRRQSLGTAGPRAVRPPHPDRVLLAQVLAAIGPIGSNVNQMARVANTIGELPSALTLLETRDALVDMRAALMRALGRTP